MTNVALEAQGKFANELPKGTKAQELFQNGVYIPTLRGLRTFGKLMGSTAGAPQEKEDIFSQRSRTDYFPKGLKTSDGGLPNYRKEKPSIFSGLTLYADVKRLLLGNKAQRQAIRNFESFLSRNFFDSQDVTIIPKEGDDVLSVKIGKFAEKPIQLLGDGIQALIILTFPLFSNLEGRLFFIEEPEIYLHPGMQRVFLDVLSKEFPQHQFFLTTHSNHFLELTNDYSEVSVFSMRRKAGQVEGDEVEPVFEIQNVSNDSFHPLEILGVRNASVFLSNCAIWVEGITDRKYLRHYLELYQKSRQNREEKFRWMRLDFEYSIIEYSGSNITHWSFLDSPENQDTIDFKRISNNVFLIADKDDPVGKKKERSQSLRYALGDNFFPL